MEKERHLSLVSNDDNEPYMGDLECLAETNDNFNGNLIEYLPPDVLDELNKAVGFDILEKGKGPMMPTCNKEGCLAACKLKVEYPARRLELKDFAHSKAAGLLTCIKKERPILE
jgi:hypothetical protein